MDLFVKGLWVCCLGVHGANRLASNSLLEALVFAHRAAEPSIAHAEHAQKHCGKEIHYAAASADHSTLTAQRALNVSDAKWIQERQTSLQTLMWENCGIVRSQKRLRSVLPKIACLYLETKEFIKSNGISTPAVELLNMITVGELIVFSAAQRRESRGLHYVTEYPDLHEAELRSTVIDTSLRKRHGLKKNTSASQFQRLFKQGSTSKKTSVAARSHSEEFA